MANKPILFSGPMVRALLAGTKTQTRRAIPKKIQNAYHDYEDWCGNVSAGIPSSRLWEREFFLGRLRIQPGDRLYVREHWRTYTAFDSAAPRNIPPNAGIQYVADDPLSVWDSRFRQAMHMPRWASRLTLTITEVRVERLQDIIEEDAKAEGADGYSVDEENVHVDGFVANYRRIWEAINGPGSWERNPWVAAYTFTVQRGNIDKLGAA